jgi:CubicO group peptidase (beta-lactamase class C family)
VKVNRVTMKLTIRAIIISVASMASIAQAQQSSPRPTDVGATTAQPDTGSEKKVADSVDAYIKTSMEKQHIPGLSLVVIRDGKIIKANGYGLASMELNVAAKPETVYELASATKPFTATAVMLLVQDGKINLDDRISKFVEDTPVTWKGITVRHLLTHTSGIKNYLGDLRRDFPHDSPPETIVRAAIEAPLNFAPGEKWSYSNTGYVLLAMIVQNVSGKSYDAFLDERVAKPLGMADTRHDNPDEVIPNRAVGYLWNGAGGLRNCDYLKYLMTNHGDRGILSTVLDLAKRVAALSTDRVLGSASKEAMWAPVRLNDGSTFDYGLGWFLGTTNAHRHVFHAGGAPGSATIISRYPDDRLTVILLANGGAAYVQGLDLGVAQRYIPNLVSHAVKKLDGTLLDSYTGYYNVFGSQVLKVTREGNSLILDDGGRLTNAFLPLSDTSFTAEDADRGFVMNREANGDVSGMTLRLVADQMQAQRIGPLVHRVERQPDADPALTRRVEGVLRAFEQGGRAVEEVAGVAPQARKDFARGPAPEFTGIRSISFLTAHDVSDRGIERHGAKVGRILYYQLLANNAPRHVLVYMTAAGLVTDEDVICD